MAPVKPNESEAYNKGSSFIFSIIEQMHTCYKFTGLFAFSYTVKTGITISLSTYLKLIGLTAMYSFLIYYDLQIGASSSIAGDKSRLFNTGIRVLITVSLCFSNAVVICTFLGRHLQMYLLNMYDTIEKEVTAEVHLAY